MKKVLTAIFVIMLIGITFGFTTHVEANSVLEVDDDGVQCPDADYGTIQEAVDNAIDGDTIMVCPGSYDGVALSKSVEIKGTDGAVITGGPAHGSGLSQGFRMLAGSDGATISQLRFEVDLAIMNGDAVNNVTVSHNEFVNAVQAVSNWRGDYWTISHNTILDLSTRCGGGIGILIGDYSGSEANNNVVSHNDISGTLHVDPNDCGGYDGTGIVLYADYRWNRLGGEILENQVTRNKIALESDTPAVVDVIAIELTDTRDDDQLTPVITDNAVGFNDLRGTTTQLALTPENLDEVNNISRNLGDNRGHGSHPSVLGPGGN